MIRAGTMGWSYGFWRGSFYPGDLPSPEFLGYYAKRFDTVEVNSTFYRVPSTQTIEGWKKQTDPDFVFSMKFPRAITHIKMLKDCREETRFFLDRVQPLGKKLGPLLLQFPSIFGSEHLSLLREFLENLPKGNRYVIEVRNRDILNESLYSVLRENNAVLAWVDSPVMPAIDTVTSDFLYVRWEGDRRKVKGIMGRKEADKSTELRSWADRLRLFSESNCAVFGYFSKYFSGDPVANVREFLAFSKNA